MYIEAPILDVAVAKYTNNADFIKAPDMSVGSGIGHKLCTEDVQKMIELISLFRNKSQSSQLTDKFFNEIAACSGEVRHAAKPITDVKKAEALTALLFDVIEEQRSMRQDYPRLHSDDAYISIDSFRVMTEDE